MSFIKTLVSTKPSDILKNKSIRKNIINSFYYFGSTFIAFLISIYTQPIFSKYLELKDFAIIGYFSSITAILYPLFSMSLPFYYLARYWNLENDETPEKNLSFILNFLNIANVIIAIVSFIVISIYFKALNVTIPLTPFIFIVLVQSFFEKYKTYYLIECRAQKNGLSFFLISVLQILINTGFSIYFVIYLKSGATGKMSGPLLASFITAMIAIFLLVKKKKYVFSFKIEPTKVKKALKYTIPLIIGAYAYYPIGNIDRLFLERLGNTSEFGYYNIGLAISGFAGTFFIALYQGFEPDLYKFIAQKRYKQYAIFITFFFFIIGSLSFLFILFSEPLVSYLTSGRYTHASSYANVFIIGLFFMQVGGVIEQIFTAFGATKIEMWRNILMGLFCVITYYLMIQFYQFQGANIARVISSVFYVLSGIIMLIWYVKKKKHMLN